MPTPALPAAAPARLQAKLAANALSILKCAEGEGRCGSRMEEKHGHDHACRLRSLIAPLTPACPLHPSACAPRWRREQGTPGAEIKVAPRPLTPQLLRRSPAVSAPVAAAIVGALREAGYLDEVRWVGVGWRLGASSWLFDSWCSWRAGVRAGWQAGAPLP